MLWSETIQFGDRKLEIVPSAKADFLDNSVSFRKLYNCTSTNRITTPYQGAENKNNSSSTTTSDHALFCTGFFHTRLYSIL
jgi:hypothetical protein